MKLLDHLLSSVALSRRRWYAAHRSAQRQLARPVISVGNLSVGGTGKTPVVMSIARQLIAAGHRPAILSRGYKRRRSADGVVVVGDGVSMRSDVMNAGDEPYMMARAIPDAAVVVSSDRYLAGRLAETQLRCTVHLLDDGFQHLKLARDVDLVIISARDLAHPHPIPLGRLREPLAAAAAADAVLVAEEDGIDSDDLTRTLEVNRVFRFNRTIDSPRLIEALSTKPDHVMTVLSPPDAVFAIAGIANPHRFFEDLSRAGWTVTGHRAFADHHYFSRAEIAGIQREAQSAGARAVLMTEKDMVRLLALNPEPQIPKAESRIPLFWIPLRVAIEPAFEPWLQQRLAEGRR